MGCKIALAALLITGIAVTLAIKVAATSTPRWLLWLGASGIGGAVAIAWEVAEYGVMRAGVGGLSLTYADTLVDLVLSTSGGAIGAWVALRWVDTRQGPGRTAAPRSFTG
jgi:hypothetical protein